MSSQNGLKREAQQIEPQQSNKPAKIRRALAACKNCRKQKTRCDHSGGAPCHRCKVLGYELPLDNYARSSGNFRLDCEFDNESIAASGGATTTTVAATSPGSAAGGDTPTIQRMDRFELRYRPKGLD